MTFEGYAQLCIAVQEATVAFHKLTPAQFNTGWVLCQLGRAYYEMVDYPAAAHVFEFARQADRHRLEVSCSTIVIILIIIILIIII